MQTVMAGTLWAEGVRALFADEYTSAAKLFAASIQDELVESKIAARRLHFLAEMLLDSGHPLEAIRHLQQAVKMDPDLKEAHIALCMSLEEVQDDDGLRAAVAAAIVEGGLWSSPRQRPAAYLPDLASQPFWDPTTFPWVQALEAASPRIRCELEEILPLLDHPRGPKPPWARVGGGHRTSGRQDGEAVLRGGWHEVVLFGAGDPEKTKEAGQARCSAALKAIQDLLPEAVSLAEAGAGEVVLSALSPGTDVLRHCGRANHRLTAHLGLSIPQESSESSPGADNQPACGIAVGGEWRCWEKDKILIFDDSFEHEVRNHAGSTRVVLLIRFWHPSLDTAQKRDMALQEIQASLARAQRLRTLPPLAPAFEEPGPTLEEQLLGRSDGTCAQCGSAEGGDLVLDEENRRVRPVCCWSYLLAVLCPRMSFQYRSKPCGYSVFGGLVGAWVLRGEARHSIRGGHDCLTLPGGWLVAVADTQFFEQGCNTGLESCGKVTLGMLAGALKPGAWRFSGAPAKQPRQCSAPTPCAAEDQRADDLAALHAGAHPEQFRLIQRRVLTKKGTRDRLRPVWVTRHQDEIQIRKNGGWRSDGGSASRQPVFDHLSAFGFAVKDGFVAMVALVNLVMTSPC
ncbi:ASPH [Symbiodinium sp. CCMP2456]|nr:ASPH [Symbiodinium sp. CCMP2456]